MSNEPFREAIALAILDVLEASSDAKTLRRTQPTVKEVTGFHREDYPAVALTDKGFVTEYLRRHPKEMIISKRTTVRMGVTVYVAYTENSESLLNEMMASIVTAIEADQTLGIPHIFVDEATSPEVTEYKEAYVDSVSCTNGQRSPFPPVFAETLDVTVTFTHTANVM